MSALVETRYGAMECLEGDSVVSRSLSLYGEWAQDELDIAAGFLRPGDVVLDVGAFLGSHTLAFARMVGPAGHVHSFEPRHEIRAILERNVRRNGLSQVQLHACGLGQRDEDMRIEAVDTGSHHNFGGLALHSADAGGGVATETIALRTLDGLALERLDFLKIDAEGMEADVLLGGRATLQRCQPVIMAECNDLAQGSRTWDVLVQLGFRVHGAVSPAFNPRNLRGEAANIFGEAAEISLIAIPQGRLELWAPVLSQRGLPCVDSLDALALLLLHKAQYPEEEWGGSEVAARLGMGFKTPLSRRLQSQLEAAETRGREAEAAHRHELDQLRAEQSRLEQCLAEAQASLERYRGSSLRFAWERLWHRAP